MRWAAAGWDRRSTSSWTSRSTSCAPPSTKRSPRDRRCRIGSSNPDALVDRLAEQIVEHATRADRQPAEPGLTEILSAADIPAETIKRVLRQYQTRSADVTEFWDSWSTTSEAEDLGDDAREVEVAIELGEVLGPDPDLLRRVHGLRREGRWQSPKDLSGFTFDDWCELIEDLEADQIFAGRRRGVGRVRGGGTGAHRGTRRGDPGHARRGVSERVHSPAVRGIGRAERRRATVIARASDHDFLGGSIRDAKRSAIRICSTASRRRTPMPHSRRSKPSNG